LANRTPLGKPIHLKGSDTLAKQGVTLFQKPILITTEQAATLSSLSSSHLRLLLRRGRIPGVKVGRDWLTTEEGVLNYLATERKPGPKAQATRTVGPPEDCTG
jgi:excisionase family DNA binding protein